MPFNGSGTYNFPSLPGSWNPAISGQAATPDDWNTLAADLTGNGLTNCITKDGQQTVTADIPFANFRLKLVGNATLLTDAPNFGQVQSLAGGIYAADTGSATAYVMTPSPAISAYTVGLRFNFKAANTNTGSSPTLAVNGLTAGVINWPNGDVLGPGDIVSGAIYTAVVDSVTTGTPTFQLQGRTDYTGVIKMSGNATADAGWLLLFGQSLLRATYAGLFAKYGTTYGSADGTHFNVPDLRGRLPAGKDDMGGSAASRLTATTMTPDGVTLGAVGGEQTHTLITAEMPAHTHLQYGIVNQTLTGGVSALVTGSNTVDTSSTGGDGAHNNVQPSLIVNYIVKT